MKTDVPESNRKVLCGLIALTVVFCIFLGLFSAEERYPHVFRAASIGLLLTVGLIHGAFDLHLDLKDKKPERSEYKRRLRWYLLLILLSGLIFLWIPRITFLGFILISAYHFGQQSLPRIGGHPKSAALTVFRAAHGLSILSALFFLNSVEVSEVVYRLIGIQISQDFYLGSLVVSFAIQGTVLTYLVRKTSLRIWDWIILQLALIALFWFFSLSSLLTAFTFYFIFWHSIPSINFQLLNNYGTLDPDAVLNFLKNSLPAWIIAVAGLLLGFAFLPGDYLIRFMIPFSMALIAPHIILMNKVIDKA